MKKLFYSVVFLFLSSFIFGQSISIEKLYSYLKFDYTLGDICELSESEMKKEKGTYFIIDATVLSILEVGSDPENFTSKIEMIDGKWISSDEVKMYKAIMHFNQNEFNSVIFARLPRKPGPEVILKNSKLSLLCKLIGYEIKDGVLVPVFEVYKYKMLN